MSFEHKTLRHLVTVRAIKMITLLNVSVFPDNCTIMVGWCPSKGSGVCSRARNVAAPWTVPLGIETSVLVMTQHWAGYTPSKYNYWRSPFHIILGLQLQKYFFLFYSLNSYSFFSFSMLIFCLFMSFLTNAQHCSEFRDQVRTKGWTCQG